MPQFINAIPADADFAIYEQPALRVVTLLWRTEEALEEGSLWRIIASADNRIGRGILIAGVPIGKSLYDADAGQFISGTLEQLQRPAPGDTIN